MSSIDSATEAIEYYVSPTGSDANPGTERKPFRTVTRAQQAARDLVAAGLQKPLNIYLREGVYELPEPLSFGPQDSGTSSASVTYTSFPGETAVLSGGQRISGWQVNEDKTWNVNVPAAQNGDRFFRNLTVDGTRAVRARWPKSNGELRIESVDEELKEFTFNKPIPASLSSENGTELVICQVWSVTRGLITEACDHRATTATAMGWVGHKPTSAMPGRAAFIEHAPECVSQPGEWFFNHKGGELTYFPREQEAPDKTVGVIPRLAQLIRVTGSPDNPVEHLHFNNLSFEHTDFPLPPFGYREIQAAHYGTVYQKEEFHVQPVAMEFVHARHCSIERCRLSHLGASGIGLGPGCRNNSIRGCEIEDIGGNGIMVGWRGVGQLHPSRKVLAADWHDAALTPTGNDVSNCRIRRCGTDSMGSVGVFVAFSADTKISHNHVHDMPYSGISVGYRWDRSESSQVRCLVENNHIHDVMNVFIDGGGIYTLGYQPGTVLRGNHIHDVHASALTHIDFKSNGFFFDEGSSGFLIEENIIYNTPKSPMRFNNCEEDWHQWKSNFIGGDTPPNEEKAKQIMSAAGPLEEE